MHDIDRISCIAMFQYSLVFLAVYFLGRQFPDKAIDLVDAACTTAARKKMQIDKEEMNTVQSSSIHTTKKPIVGPEHVAQVNIIFLARGICFNCLNQCYEYVMCVLTFLSEGCEPMDRNSYHHA
jgi:hypothetical protein